MTMLMESTAKKNKTSEDPLKDVAMTEEGWIWNLYKIRHLGMMDEKVKALEQEGTCLLQGYSSMCL